MIFISPPTKQKINIKETIIGSKDINIGGDFTLIDSQNKSVSSADFHGKFLLIYFGFTFCPDICPTELNKIATIMEMLGSDADKLQPIFITIDPERDKAEKLKKYTEQFDHRIIGLTGSVEQIREVAKEFKVYFDKDGGGENYMINHSSLIYLMDKDGKFNSYFTQNMKLEDIVKEIKSNL
jgi:protein SCO1/2